MLYHGDARAILPTLAAASVDAVVTDPPYELAFMGRGWDRSGIANDVDLWRAVLRVLKPGGHLLAFGGTRTAHRMVCAIEDAGFEIRDTVVWLYGQGFPKSLDVGKALDKAAGATRERIGTKVELGIRHNPGRENITSPAWARPWRDDPEADGHWVTAPATDLARQWDGWGTALKPAHEPIVLARAPLSEPTVAANVSKWGTGALNIDGGRLATVEIGKPRSVDTLYSTPVYGQGRHGGSNGTGATSSAGRWPPNVCLTHTLWCEPVGTRRVRGIVGGSRGASTRIYGGGNGLTEAQPDVRQMGYAAPDGTETVEAWACAAGCPVFLLDQQAGERAGGYRRNPSQTDDADRTTYQRGWTGFRGERGYADTGGASRFMYVAKASAAERSRGLPDGERNGHPTVKPLALMRWLLTLVVPPGGVVLDPFAGSGSTLVAAAELGIEAIGIEQDAGYCATAQARLGAAEVPA